MKFSHRFVASFFVIGAVFGAPALATAEGLGVAPDAPGLAVPGIAVPGLAAPEVPAEGDASASSEPAPDAGDVVAAAIGAGGPPALPAAESVEVTPPPLPVLPAYYVGIAGKPVGPLDEAALREKVASGDLDEDSLVWTEGMADWAPAADVTEIAALLEPEAPAMGAKAGDGKTPKPAAADASGLAGGWEIDGMIKIEGIGYVPADVLQVFNPDGSYRASGTIISTVPGYGPQPVEMTVETVGSWTARVLADGSVELTLHGASSVGVPSLGLAPVKSPVNETVIIRVAGPDTLIDQSGNAWTRV